MHYIELPKEVKTFQTDDNGYHFFIHQDVTYYLSDIIQQASNHVFCDPMRSLSLSVTPRCPNEDKLYLEYLDTKKPNAWCQIHNGRQKNNDINRYLSQNKPWVSSIFFHALDDEKKDKELERRKEQKEDRYTKGNKSW